MNREPVTKIGGPGGPFPSTLWTVILGARQADAVHVEQLCRLYWKPVYWLVRMRWNRGNEDAKDLTQEFFAAVLEKEFLKSVSPEQGRFRAFVRAALENFMRNRNRDEQRLKRGGGRKILSLEDPAAPIFEPPANGEAYDAAFDRIWARSLMQDCIEELRAEYRTAGREKTFAIFEAYDLAAEPPSYSDVAARMGVTEDTVRGALRRVRDDLRALLRDRILPTLANPAELDDEMRHLFDAR